jgi:hypothetical protein
MRQRFGIAAQRHRTDSADQNSMRMPRDGIVELQASLWKIVPRIAA